PLICEIEHEITRLNNELRGSSAPLSYHAKLAYVSRDWSEQQASAGRISHTGFPQARGQLYVATFGTTDPVSIRAENVAYSSSRSTDAKAIAAMFVNMWAGSSGHRRNMLGPYSLLGIGVVKKGNTFYATQIFGN